MYVSRLKRWWYSVSNIGPACTAHLICSFCILHANCLQSLIAQMLCSQPHVNMYKGCMLICTLRTSWAHARKLNVWRGHSPTSKFLHSGCEIVIRTVPITGHEVYKRKTKLHGACRFFVRVLASLYNEAEVAVKPLQLE